ncbi:DUF7619 domain-containing protein, partial [Clostridium sp.]|uniref:DUF7619 domain-containing protein n=1 Tax=Clostridium sp. TaxID=1506 RepID=UPI003F32576C
MALTNVFSSVQRGEIIFTGNTLGLAGYSTLVVPLPTGTTPPLLPGPGAVDSIGTFITTQNLTAPGGWPQGTTDSYLQNSSSAIANILSGSTVLHAELVWAGTAINQNGNVLGNLNDPINFTSPVGTTQITANLVKTVIATGSANTYYIANADVTSLVQAGGAGTYTVGAVPGAIGNSVNTIPPFTPPNNVTPQDFLGWTLMIAYRNDSLPVRNLDLWVNDTLVNAAGLPQDINVTGLATATTGAVAGKLFLSSGEGDANIPGDQALFGPNTGSLVNIGNIVPSINPNPGTAPNNPNNNFFGSQINGNNGLLDTSGTFGTSNQDSFQRINYPAARQGWDITSVDVSNELLNNQTSAVIRLTTIGDSYVNSSVGLQVNALEPIFTLTKNVDKTDAYVGDTLTYTIVMTNISIINADNVIFTDTIQPQASFVPGSVTINNISQPVADPQTGINLGTIIPNETVTIKFTVKVNSLPPTPPTPPQVFNDGAIDYTFEAVVGEIITGKDTTNQVSTNIETPNLNVLKSVDKAFADINDIITYTVTLINEGTIALNDVLFQDTIPAGTAYIPGSLTVTSAPVGVTFTGTNPETGVTINSIAPSQVVTITWKVQIGNTVPNPNPIPNIGRVSSPLIPEFNTNTVTTLVNNADLNIVKSVNKAEAVVGELVTYTITVSNVGSTNANPVTLTDIVPNGTTFVPTSVIIDGIQQPAADPNAGISIGPITPGQTRTIIFTVTIDVLPNPNPMPNKATINYQYIVNPLNPPVQVTKDSNTVFTRVGVAQVTKSVDKSFANFGEIVTYTVFLNNTGTAPVNNIFVQDTIPNGTTFVPGSLTVTSAPAGVTFTGTNPETGISIPTVIQGQLVTITWKVQVGNVFPNPNPIPNIATVSADGLTPVTTNTVTTQVNNATLAVV